MTLESQTLRLKPRDSRNSRERGGTRELFSYFMDDRRTFNDNWLMRECHYRRILRHAFIAIPVAETEDIAGLIYSNLIDSLLIPFSKLLPDELKALRGFNYKLNASFRQAFVIATQNRFLHTHVRKDVIFILNLLECVKETT